MSHHMDERNTPELDALLRLHRMATDTPSQLADAFRLGYWAAQAEIARLQADVERLAKERDEAREGWHVEMPNSDTAHNAAIEAAAKVCAAQRKDFLSEEYAVGQPAASFSERFACDQCEQAIRSLKRP